MGADFLLGLIAAKVLGRPSAGQRPAEVLVPAAPPPPPPAPSSPAAPSTPGHAPAPAPSFPVEVPVLPPPGMKKAIEIWQVRPDVAATGSMLVGAMQAQTLPMLESSFPNGWLPCAIVSKAEVETAKSLLGQWRKGGVVFTGPSTLAGRRAYRMTEHPREAAQPKPTPVAPRPPAAPTTPASVSTPAPPPVQTAPVPPPVVVPPEDRAITTVRKNEGLAQVAKRLGMPENATSAKELRAANIPHGPDARWEQINLNQGGIKKVGRPGGLQPGDRLFVPTEWGRGPIDPSRL